MMPDTKHQNDSYEIIRALFDPEKKLSDRQIQLFLEVAKEKKLDPKTKQICLIPKYNKITSRCEPVIIVQIDGFRTLAERTDKYAPGKATEYLYDENKRLVCAIAFVKKLTSDGTWHEISESAYLSEYSEEKNFIWKKMPHVMLAKCAEARALRRAFPSDLCGIYTDDEIADIKDENNENKDENNKPEEKKLTPEQIEELNILLESQEGLSEQFNVLLKAKGYKSMGDIEISKFKSVKTSILELKNKKGE